MQTSKPKTNNNNNDNSMNNNNNKKKPENYISQILPRLKLSKTNGEPAKIPKHLIS